MVSYYLTRTTLNSKNKKNMEAFIMLIGTAVIATGIFLFIKLSDRKNAKMAQ